MRHARYILAATLIATVLCADRAVDATRGQSPRNETARVASLAERLASRFSSTLRRGSQVLQLERAVVPDCTNVADVDSINIDIVPVSTRLDPLLINLPPPAC